MCKFLFHLKFIQICLEPSLTSRGKEDPSYLMGGTGYDAVGGEADSFVYE